MKQYAIDLWNKWMGSFDSDKNTGFSARKLTSFAVVIVMLFLQIKFTDSTNLWEVCTIDAGLITSLLGIVAWQQNAELKNKKNNADQTN